MTGRRLVRRLLVVAVAYNLFGLGHQVTGWLLVYHLSLVPAAAACYYLTQITIEAATGRPHPS